MANGSSVIHVIVVGGGFAGVACAKRLAGEPGVRVTLLDADGRHQFQPLLYQVATAELTASDIRFELDEIFASPDNVEVRAGRVVAADPDRHAVTLDDGSELTGDVLVIAAGTRPNFFRVPGAEEYSYPLYSVADAERVRIKALRLFHDAAAKPELVEEGALTFVIVGAGPTGVETAGALAELAHDIMPYLYEHLSLAAARVIIVDGGQVVLRAFSDQAHEYAAAQLRRRGVELRLGVAVKEVGPEHVTLSDGTTIKTQLVVWGGGVTAADLAGASGLPQGRGGRIDVRPDLTVAGHDRVYAIGDIANIPYGDEPSLPQLGSVAQQSGVWAAENILAEIAGAPRRSFHYRDKGIMAMIGRKAAVAEIGEHRHELHGRFAFAAWLGVHAQLLANAGAELNAFHEWAEEFYLHPHRRSSALLDPDGVDKPRIHWRTRET
jgi:NADH:quinone reductase (non-electrogenic)